VARRYNVLCWWLNSTRGNFNDRCQITQSEWCVTYHSVKNRPRRQSQHVRRIAAHHPVWHRPYCQLTPDSHGRRRLRPPRQRELRVGDTGRNSRTVWTVCNQPNYTDSPHSCTLGQPVAGPGRVVAVERLSLFSSIPKMFVFTLCAGWNMANPIHTADATKLHSFAESGQAVWIGRSFRVLSRK